MTTVRDALTQSHQINQADIDCCTNKFRASRAMNALEAYARDDMDDELPASCGDLLTDLFHLLAQFDEDPWSIIGRARRNFVAELADDVTAS